MPATKKSASKTVKKPVKKAASKTSAQSKTSTTTAKTSVASTAVKTNKGNVVFSKNLVIAIAVIAIIGGFLIGKIGGSSFSLGDNDVATLSSGLDQGKRVRNVGDVEEVISNWINENPKAIIDSVNNMQKKAAEDRIKNAQKNIAKKKDELFNDKNSGQYAPRGYDVTIVEFFDYNCGYCKRAKATIDSLIKQDKKVRVVFKEFPILGQASMESAQVAVATQLMQPKSYFKLHKALMKSKKRGKKEALNVAASVGINKVALENFMKKNEAKINDAIQANLALGSEVGITGTPGFIIGEELIPGAVGIEQIKEKIAKLR